MNLRVNIRQLKGLIWLGCAGLFLWDGWTFWEIYEKKQDDRYDSQPLGHFEEQLFRGAGEVPSVERGRSLPPEEAYVALWQAKVDGTDPYDKAPVVVEKGPDTAPKQALKKIEDVLEVGLIFWATDPARRFVAVEYKEAQAAEAMDGKTRRLHLSQGEPLAPPYDEAPYNARIVAIDQQTVTFQWGEDEQVITPGLGREGTGVPVADWKPGDMRDPTEAYAKAPAESVYVEEGVWLIGSDDRKQLGNVLGEQLKVRTRHPSTGERSFLEITDVEEGSLAFKYGAKPGMKIISVNSIPMTSQAAAINWAKANPDLPEYVVKYEHQGVEKTVTFYNKP